MTESIAKAFHTYSDAELVRVYPKLFGGVITTTETKHIIVQEREVGYRFYPHKHSFVPQLIRLLITKSISGLQAADTDYQKKSDGSIATLPDGKFKPTLYADYFTTARYNPSGLVKQPFPVMIWTFPPAAPIRSTTGNCFFTSR
jgi:hypothetical protein